MSEQLGPKRPLGVTIVAALAVVSGAFDIIGGIVLLSMQSDPTTADAFGAASVATSLAVMEIAIGIIMVLIAVGLLRGNTASRIAATIVQAISLAGSIWIGVAQPATLPTEIVSALVALAILMLLWSAEATRYFKGLAPDQPTS
jgi:hypothetical protein